MPRKPTTPGTGARRCAFCNAPESSKNPLYPIEGQDVCGSCIRDNEEQLAAMLLSLRADDPTAGSDSDDFGLTPLGMAVDALLAVEGGDKRSSAHLATSVPRGAAHPGAKPRVVPSPKE